MQGGGGGLDVRVWARRAARRALTGCRVRRLKVSVYQSLIIG